MFLSSWWTRGLNLSLAAQAVKSLHLPAFKRFHEVVTFVPALFFNFDSTKRGAQKVSQKFSTELLKTVWKEGCESR